MAKDFLNDTVFPALFERLDTALPEFHFHLKQKGDGRRLWESRSGARPDGYTGSEAGKTFVDERTPFYLSDLNPMRGRSIWAYLKERDGLDNGATFRLLCELADTKPEANLSPEALERMQAAQRRAEIFEAANVFFLDQLHTAKSSAAEAARQYLKQRGYSLPELRQPEQELKDGYTGGERMEVGYCPNLPDLRQYLERQTRAVKTTDETGAEVVTEAQRFTPEEIQTVLPPYGAAGRVSLTLRERGRIVGFSFRSVDGKEPKYLNLEGYKKEQHLPGLTRCGNVVLVEGWLDMMRAHAAGLVEVAALGGTSISPAQIEAALRAGATSLTLALDNDQPGQTATRAAVEALLRYQEKTGKEFAVFVCQYPAGVKDFDELLRDGKEAAAEMLRLRLGVSRYLSNWLDTVRAEEIAKAAGGYSTDVFREELLREVVLLERLVRPVDVPHLRQLLEPFYRTYGINAEAVAAKADSVRTLEAEKLYRAELREIGKKAEEALLEGKTEEAERLLWNTTREARLRLHSGRFAELLEGQTREAVAAELARLGDGLTTSYTLTKNGNEVALEFPAGGVSVVAAPSGHGKTAFLINAALDVCERNPDKVFHFFTLEESGAAVTAKALNTFLDLDLSARNERSLEHYLRGNGQYIAAGKLPEMQGREAKFWQLIGSRLFVHYLEDNTAENLCEAIRWLHGRGNVGGVFVDYIQLINLTEPGRMDRQKEMKQVCLQLKNAAVDTGLPLVFAAQFNRTATTEEATHDYTNIGEAGDIERVAALIIGLWNREFTREAQDKNGNPVAGTGPAPLMAAKILKWRGGPVGYTAAWNYDGNRKRIYPGPLAPQSQGATTYQKAANAPF